ncbi:MAG TPA: hypothetical protein VFQ34_12900 [Nitrospiraceae bacterium]|nr:hypothetical protein [Nitrospiraceae bacterium]
MGPEILSQVVLARPDLLTFPSNRTDWERHGTGPGSMISGSAGQAVCYGSHGRRILAVDPGGRPLHECEWEVREGAARLVRARIHLEWGQWVGLVPAGMVNENRLDLSRKPGWQRVSADDLRAMAAQSLGVPLEEVRFFYTDRDVTIAPSGLATIRQRKDALYVLPDGTFDRRRFMACMGAMHWERIDFLPVVELFLSLLPGTGSAVMELIRGLYDDQQRGALSARVLRYRGIPTYPSAAAYRLFSAFFRPEVPGGGDPFPLFMDPPKSHLVSWLPASDSPRRCWDAGNRLCVTVKGDRIIKATLADDSAGLPYQAADSQGHAPCERTLAVRGNTVLLMDRDLTQSVPVEANWGQIADSEAHAAPLAVHGWRMVFARPPQVAPQEAFSAVLLYPEDDREIDELATQPFVADYVQDWVEQDSHVAGLVARAERVLISRFDASITTCIGTDRPRHYSVHYEFPAYAQRQAQHLWNTWAKAGWLNSLPQVRMRPVGESESEEPFHLIYEWIPFSLHASPERIGAHLSVLAQRLMSGASAFVAGPPSLPKLCSAVGLQADAGVAVESLPTFKMHRTIIPKASLKPGLTLYRLTKRR